MSSFGAKVVGYIGKPDYLVRISVCWKILDNTRDVLR